MKLGVAGIIDKLIAHLARRRNRVIIDSHDVFESWRMVAM